MSDRLSFFKGKPKADAQSKAGAQDAPPEAGAQDKQPDTGDQGVQPDTGDQGVQPDTGDQETVPHWLPDMNELLKKRQGELNTLLSKEKTAMDTLLQEIKAVKTNVEKMQSKTNNNNHDSNGEQHLVQLHVCDFQSIKHRAAKLYEYVNYVYCQLESMVNFVHSAVHGHQDLSPENVIVMGTSTTTMQELHATLNLINAIQLPNGVAGTELVPQNEIGQDAHGTYLQNPHNKNDKVYIYPSTGSVGVTQAQKKVLLAPAQRRGRAVRRLLGLGNPRPSVPTGRMLAQAQAVHFTDSEHHNHTLTTAPDGTHEVSINFGQVADFNHHGNGQFSFRDCHSGQHWGFQTTNNRDMQRVIHAMGGHLQHGGHVPSHTQLDKNCTFVITPLYVYC